MSSLEQFVYDTTKKHPSEVGVVSEQEVTLQTLIATRRFFTSHRLNGKRRRGSKLLPEVIHVPNGENYLIDGHHKTKRNIDQGLEIGACRVLETSNYRILRRLAKMAQGFIKDLPLLF